MIHDIRLQRFRSYSDTTFEFGDHVNIIVGPNASGKTNLLEALLVVSSGSSYRGRDLELPQQKKSWSRIVAHTPDGERVVKLELTNEVIKKSYNINGQPLSRLSLSKILPTVLFEPDDLRLVSGGPELRRDFLDELLEQTITGYSNLRRNYRRALAQRNRLLKFGEKQAATQLFAWDIRLSELGGQIASYRAEVITKFNTKISKLYQQISRTKKRAALHYAACCPISHYSSALLKILEVSRSKDFERGFTAYGPHREDMTIELGGQNAQTTASRGENRTLLLALKIMELKLLEDVHNKKPLLLLDDVFSELDGARRRALTNFLQDYQTFITTTDADVVIQHFMGECTIIPTTNS